MAPSISKTASVLSGPPSRVREGLKKVFKASPKDLGALHHVLLHVVLCFSTVNLYFLQFNVQCAVPASVVLEHEHLNNFAKEFSEQHSIFRGHLGKPH